MGSSKSMGSKEDIVQNVFNIISLEKNPAMWQSEVDTKEANKKRIRFLAEFEETLFEEALCMTKSPSRKNDVLAKALLLKSEKAGEKDKKEGLKLVSQALSFGSEELWDTLANRRSQLWEEVGELKHALSDALLVKNIDDEWEKRIVRLA